MSNKIERLDLSKPPGYILEEVPGPEGAWRWRCCGETNTADGPISKERANAAAWAHYQARHDPPGLTVFRDAMCGPGNVWWVGDAKTMRGLSSHHGKPAARAAAWNWYWRRKGSWDKTMEVVRAAFGKTLADTVSAELVGAALWPDILTWSDEKMDSHETQIATAETQVVTAAWKHAHG